MCFALSHPAEEEEEKKKAKKNKQKRESGREGGGGGKEDEGEAKIKLHLSPRFPTRIISRVVTYFPGTFSTRSFLHGNSCA